MMSLRYLCLIIIQLVYLMSNHMVRADGYAQMRCYLDHNYLNNWDDYLDTGLSSVSGYFLAGQYSYHDNHREDRRYKWRYCRPSNDPVPFTSVRALRTTWWDASWSVGCHGNEALFGAYSFHDNGREDRRWRFTCATLKHPFSLRSCSWSGYVNNWDAVLNYACPNNGVIRHVHSYHDNHREDRRWKFYCCRVWDSTCSHCPHAESKPLSLIDGGDDNNTSSEEFALGLDEFGDERDDYYPEDYDGDDHYPQDYDNNDNNNNNGMKYVWNELSSTQQNLAIFGVIALFVCGALLGGAVLSCMRGKERKFIGLASKDVEEEVDEMDDLICANH